MLKQKHLIAGEWIGSDTTFFHEATKGDALAFPVGNPELVDRAASAAEEAFWQYGYSKAEARAAFLDSIAAELENRRAEIVDMGQKETGLPETRLHGELGRTVGQLRLFATHIVDGMHLDVRHDAALPDRTPLPRPDLRLAQRPLGPVAVFGASNFPLAFSTAGGDTAAALAAGCPVVVKGHSAHPGVADLAAQAIDAAIKKHKLHPGVFSQIQGGDRAVGSALVQHPLINAVGFTGSLAGGRALFDLCAARPVPIPFFGELGSVNPMFILPAAATSRTDEIAKGWATSLTMGAGQFCTNPGVAIISSGPDADAFIRTAHDAMKAVAPQTMLTTGIARAYHAGADGLSQSANVEQLVVGTSELREGAANLFVTTGDAWLQDDALSEEVFGPLGLIVIADGIAQMREIALKLHGQLTCTLHLDEEDLAVAAGLLPVLERKAGRLLTNGFPTGVEVCDSMVHGGPYPASTNFGATSVGTMSIRRFLRPVCYQNMPLDLLPEGLA